MLLGATLWIKSYLLSTLGFEFTSSVLVGVVDNFELPRVDVEDGSYEDVLELYAWVFAAFEKDAFIFDVELL